jgi:RNA polymerase sigma-70 factor (ECF subfamily)
MRGVVVARRFTASDSVLAEIYRDHFDFVVRKAARLGGPGIDAEDVAQDVFLVVARRLDSYDGTSELTTWLYGITLNVVRSWRRRMSVRMRADVHADNRPVAYEPLDRVELREAHVIAADILDKIGKKKREVFVLAEICGWTGGEIAERTGTKVDTVSSRLHYARKEFAQRLSKRVR